MRNADLDVWRKSVRLPLWKAFCPALLLNTGLCHAIPQEHSPFQHPFYIGGMGGYGATTWGGLVPLNANEEDREALIVSTPIKVVEGGEVWGVFGGYELLPSFAIEASYTHYPDATVTFDELSLFSFLHDEATTFVSKTETVNLMGKVMFVVPRTAVRLYSSAGLAGTHREDRLLDQWRPTPTFGVGINYHPLEHVMAEIAGNYTAGFGQAELSPTNSYFPFLYSVVFRLALCF